MGTAGDCGIARSRPKEGAEDGGDAQQTEVSTWTVAPDRCEKAVEGSRKSCGAADAAIVLVRLLFSISATIPPPLARRVGPRSGPEDFVGLTGLAAPALLGWGLRVTVCAWSVSVWVGPR